MLNKLIAFLLVTYSSLGNSSKILIKIAVIDTGLNVEKAANIKLCNKGHYDFMADKKEVPKDTHGHGTNVALTIVQNLANINYCLIIIKYDYTNLDFNVKVNSISKAINRAIDSKVSIINFSTSGKTQSDIELKAINRASLRGIKFIAAAGNDGLTLVKSDCNVYPACYLNIKNLTIVGNKSISNTIQPSSNRGHFVDTYEIGKSCFNKECLEGTSQATAVYSGKLAYKLYNEKIKGSK